MLEGTGNFETQQLKEWSLPVIHIGNIGIRVGLWKKGSILALSILSFLIDIEERYCI